MNCSFTKLQIHNYLIEQGFQFNNNKIPNASLLNHINNDRLTFARIHVKYNIPVHLKSQQLYYSMDYISNKNVYVELKTLRHTVFEKYECIDLLSYHEYTIFKKALNEKLNTLFSYLYILPKIIHYTSVE